MLSTSPESSHLWHRITTAELEQLVHDGQLHETSSLDAKALPPSAKELAKDIAAMAMDGGVLVFGVQEDESRHPTQLVPFPLAGAKETVSNVVATCIAESPSVIIRELLSTDDPARGYLVVIVPQSDRAPHMVEVGKDNRFYGRDATGNRRLSEGEVARLYARRTSFERGRDSLLDEEIGRVGCEVPDTRSHLHLLCSPVVTQPQLLWTLGGDAQILSRVRSFAAAAVQTEVFPHSFGMDLHELPGWGMTTEGCRASTGDLEYRLELVLDSHGTGHLFCDHVGTRWLTSERPPICLHLPHVLGLTRRFQVFMAQFYRATTPLLTVDIALCVRGLGDVVAYFGRNRHQPYGSRAYHQDEYRSGFRCPALLLDEEARAISMLEPLFRSLATDQWRRVEGMPPTLRGQR